MRFISFNNKLKKIQVFFKDRRKNIKHNVLFSDFRFYIRNLNFCRKINQIKK